MIEVENCPICGANSFKEVYQAPYFRGDNQLFSIKECLSCHLWFTSPRPEDEELGKYYDVENYVSHTDNARSLVDRIYHTVRKVALKQKLNLINSLSNTKGSLLDYGAGTGYFLGVAKENGWNVQGVEPSENARKVALEKSGIRMVASEDFIPKPQTFDRITLWHVLEHLPGLKAKFEMFTKALKPGGFLIVAVPNHESYDSIHYGKNWAALDVPLHLYHFKKKNVRDLSKQFGLELVEIKNMPFDSVYVSLLSEKIRDGKSNYLKALLTGLKSNLKGFSDKNASSLIYILKKPL